MTTFKQYLLEAEGHDLSGFAHNIQIMLDNKIFLYRGTNTLKTSLTMGAGSWDTFTGFIASERTIQRTPKGSKIASKLSASWEVPNRNLSYFVTRDPDHAARFGNLLLVIPADSVSQFAWSATDFNQGEKEEFKTHFHTIEFCTEMILEIIAKIDRISANHFQDEVLQILDSVKISQTEARTLLADDPKAIKILNAFIFNLDKLTAVAESLDRYESLQAQVILHRITIVKNSLEKIGITDVAEVYAGANSESFKIITFDSLDKIPNKPTTSDELWFNGKYLAINLDGKHSAEKDSIKILNQLLKEV